MTEYSTVCNTLTRDLQHQHTHGDQGSKAAWRKMMSCGHPRKFLCFITYLKSHVSGTWVSTLGFYRFLTYATCSMNLCSRCENHQTGPSPSKPNCGHNKVGELHGILKEPLIARGSPQGCVHVMHNSPTSWDHSISSPHWQLGTDGSWIKVCHQALSGGPFKPDGFDHCDLLLLWHLGSRWSVAQCLNDEIKRPSHLHKWVSPVCISKHLCKSQTTVLNDSKCKN